MNQAQRKRAFEMIDELVATKQTIIKKTHACDFVLSEINHKIKFNITSIIDMYKKDKDFVNCWRGYDSSCRLDLLAVFDLEQKYKEHIEALEKKEHKRNEQLNNLATQLKDEIMFGDDISIINNALEKIKNWEN